MPRLIALLVALLALLTACSSARPAAEPTRYPACPPDGPVSPGERLPDCSFEGLDGKPLRLASLEGTPQVLNFWASWCGNCIKEMPAFNRVAAATADRVGFVGMDLLDVLGESRTTARRFAAKTGVRYSLAYDPSGLLYGHFGAAAHPVMPLTVFVDSNLVVKERHFGELTEDDLRSLIKKYFAIVV